MTFSAIDPEIAPPGKHTLFLWAQYFPYELADGARWDDIREQVADTILEVLYRYAPNMRGKIIDRFIQTPLDLERRLGLPRGNVMHLEMTVSQMFALPSPGWRATGRTSRGCTSPAPAPTPAAASWEPPAATPPAWC